MLALLLLAGALQGPPPRPTPPGRPTEVEGVTVTAAPGAAPRLVSSYPAQGAAVAGGTTVVKLTFDQKMSPTGWSFGAAAGGADLPRCLDRPRLLADGRTFVLLCVTTPKRSWALRLNGAGTGFVAAGGKAAAPVDLTFTTTDERIVAPLADALKAAGLEDDQGPIMDDAAQAPASPSGGGSGSGSAGSALPPG